MTKAMRASVDLQLCEYPLYDLPDRFGRKPFAPAMVAVTAEQCAAPESVTIQIFPQHPDRRGVQMNWLLIVPAFAADQMRSWFRRSISPTSNRTTSICEALETKRERQALSISNSVV